MPSSEPHWSWSSSSARAQQAPLTRQLCWAAHQPQKVQTNPRNREGNKQAAHGGLGMHRLGLKQIRWLCVVLAGLCQHQGAQVQFCWRDRVREKPWIPSLWKEWSVGTMSWTQGDVSIKAKHSIHLAAPVTAGKFSRCEYSTRLSQLARIMAFLFQLFKLTAAQFAASGFSALCSFAQSTFAPW